jgi:hypothetical protein
VPDDAALDLRDQREPDRAVRAQRIDDPAFERLVEGGVVHRADGRDVVGPFFTDGDRHVGHRAILLDC